MEQKFYKREGRKFVQVEIPIMHDYSGKYYQKDGSFTDERTEDSIGLCIMSTLKEHVVMSLGNYFNYEFSFHGAKYNASLAFDGKGELPKSHELMIAIILFKEKLNIEYWKDIWCINSTTYASAAAIADDRGDATHYAASYAPCVAELRPIIRIPQNRQFTLFNNLNHIK